MIGFKKILVTGGAGFVGRHMTGALLRRGFKVRVIDNFSCSSPRALDGFRGKIELIKGDVRHGKDVAKAVKGVDAVYHFAAIRSVARSVEDPMLSHEVNASGALNLLYYSHEYNVKHFIFTSTSAVYGDAITRYQREDGKLSPISPYGAAKLAAEFYARHYTRDKGLPTTSFRIFNVYGPQQNPESRYSLAVPGLLSNILKGRRPVIDGSGEQSRDFIYIDDILNALFKCLGNKTAYGQVYNLGSGRADSIHTLAGKLLKLTGSKLKPTHGPRRPGDPERTCADTAKVYKDLKWEAKISLEEGLRRTVEWAKRSNNVF